MKKSIILSIVVIFVILIIDQALKIWVKTDFYLYESVELIGNKVQLHFVENPGMAFGMELWGGNIGKILLSIFRIIAIAGLIYFLIQIIKKQQNMILVLCVSLIIAGAMGNLIDSAFYGLIFNESTTIEKAILFPESGGYAPFLMGKVVDMFYCPLFKFPEWLPWLGGQTFFSPIFNVADSAITISVFIAIIFYKKIFKNNSIKKHETAENIVIE